jgi:NAD(P)-dependent dehydrogenase (short-subunit alcohol dehydrogenase family)
LLSPGIGKSLAWKLAGQGLNVAVVALDDKLLADTVDELRSAFPNCEFLSVSCSAPHARINNVVALVWPLSVMRSVCGLQVGANLGTPGYLSVIQKATDKLPISLVFCNAGYMVTGFFNKTYVLRI